MQESIHALHLAFDLLAQYRLPPLSSSILVKFRKGLTGQPNQKQTKQKYILTFLPIFTVVGQLHSRPVFRLHHLPLPEHLVKTLQTSMQCIQAIVCRQLVSHSIQCELRPPNAVGNAADNRAKVGRHAILRTGRLLMSSRSQLSLDVQVLDLRTAAFLGDLKNIVEATSLSQDFWLEESPCCLQRSLQMLRIAQRIIHRALCGTAF
jgi:hypothetical protein